VADGEMLTDITQIVPDLLHLHLRTTERVLGHYRTMLDEAQAEQLLIRLETAKLGNVTFYEKHTKKRWAVKLDGGQCEKVLLAATDIFQLPGGDAERTPFHHVVERFVTCWRLLLSAEATAEAQVNGITELRQALNKGNVQSLINNSMHVLVAHVPDYLLGTQPFGGLRAFSQQGTEARVKWIRRVLNRVVSRKSAGASDVLRVQTRILFRQFAQLSEVEQESVALESVDASDGDSVVDEL